jgi:hypothetical protein
MGSLKRYLDVLTAIRLERGEWCECCGSPAHHGHHIIPVGETSIHSDLVFNPANIMIMCGACHALMHPLKRNINEWKTAQRNRGQALSHLI